MVWYFHLFKNLHNYTKVAQPKLTLKTSGLREITFNRSTLLIKFELQTV